MKPHEVETLLIEAAAYPADLRAAARLHLEGVTFVQLNSHPLGLVPAPTRVAVLNDLRDIERGQYEHDGRLWEIAKAENATQAGG